MYSVYAKKIDNPNSGGEHASIQTCRFPGFASIFRYSYIHAPAHVVTTDDVDFAVVGIPFDTGVTFRAGARFGPEAIRSNSVILKPYNIAQDIDLFEYLSGVDYGDLAVVPGFIDESYTRIEAGLLPLVQNHVVPVALGGDHAITLAELRAVAQVHGPVALVQFDSHTDTNDAYFGQRYNHGTPFIRAVEEGLLLPEHSIQVGIRGSVYSRRDLEIPAELGLDLLTAVEAQAMGPARSSNVSMRAWAGPRCSSPLISISWTPPMPPGPAPPRSAVLRPLRAWA